MRYTKIILALVAATAVSGCLDSKTNRGVVGAAGGAVIGETLGVNPLTGALLGAAAGVISCDLPKNKLLAQCKK